MKNKETCSKMSQNSQNYFGNNIPTIKSRKKKVPATKQLSFSGKEIIS